jgi:hypothetical protein
MLFSNFLEMPPLFFYDNVVNLLRHVISTHLKCFVFLTTALFSCLHLQKKSLQDGIHLFHQPDIHIRLKRILLFLWYMFKLHRYNQFLEISAASKEIVSFHDNGVVLLRLAFGPHK